ncbi:hypothetical protein NDU88_011199 [Pleurodeles waltl]|uniref:Secreted protein n=1 Tax=Pleurodeles waltl TaxID=8319 RepID=A0AAV7R2P8_PLEWA|nr:hypothetical protein NDU88_011199 [Pleurodeles waltl]
MRHPDSAPQDRGRIGCGVVGWLLRRLSLLFLPTLAPDPLVSSSFRAADPPLGLWSPRALAAGAVPRFPTRACRLLFSRGPGFLPWDLRHSAPPPAARTLRTKGPLPATRATRSVQVRNPPLSLEPYYFMSRVLWS